MKEKEQTGNEKQMTEKIEKEKTEKPKPKRQIERVFDPVSWSPKTQLGKKVKNGEITDIETIMDSGIKIKEIEIIDMLIPNIESELLLVGQAKGKFGGGQRRIFRQTQKKTREGNKPRFTTVVACGNHDGYIGIGSGKSKETVPAREKAYRNAKLNLIKIRRGCGSWQCGCNTPHTIPFKVKGKCGSVELELIPAPKGTGLVIENECKKILAFAGIKDIWSRSSGKTTTKMNLVMACFDALKQLIATKVRPESFGKLGIVEGRTK